MASAYTRFCKTLENSSLPSSYKLVLAKLIDLEGFTDSPKIETLARQLKINRRTVERALKKFRELGVIDWHWGQRASIYSVATDWESLIRHLIRQKAPLIRQNVATRYDKKSHQKPAGPYYCQDSFSNIEKESSRETVTKLSKAPDLAGTLSLCRALYNRLGLPVNEQLCLQLMLSYPPEDQALMGKRLPDFIKYQIVTGRWSHPKFTKSLENVLRDKDWNSELPPLRDLPEPRKPTLAEEQYRRYVERAKAGGQ